MSTSRWVLAALLCLATASVQADIRIPGKPYSGRAKQPGEDQKERPPRDTTASFEVMVATTGGSGTPLLVIPRGAIKDLLADASGPVGIEDDRIGQSLPAAARESIDPVAEATAAAGSPSETSLETPRLHSMIAGLAVAMAVALGGVWIARTRSRTTGRGLALLISASICLGISVTAWANVPPPKVFPKKEETSTRLETAFTGKVQIKIVSGDGTVQLVLPRSDVAKLAEKGGSRASER
jgi:hypothetical protein